MCHEFEDPQGLVPHELDAQDSRAYEERTVEALRERMIGSTAGPVIIDEIELVGFRPDTLVIFRYHHHPSYVGRDAALVAGPCAEAAKLWEFAVDPGDRYSGGKMEAPPVLAASIGSAFEGAELPLVDPVTLIPVGSPPKVFPRVMSDGVAELMRKKFETWRSAQAKRGSRGSPGKD